MYLLTGHAMGSKPPVCHPPRWTLATPQLNDHYHSLPTSQVSTVGTPGPSEAILHYAPPPTATSPVESSRVHFEEAIRFHHQASLTPSSKFSDHLIAPVSFTSYFKSPQQKVAYTHFLGSSYNATHMTPVPEPSKSAGAPDFYLGRQATPMLSTSPGYYDQYASLTSSPFSITSQQELSSESPQSSVGQIKTKRRRSKQLLQTGVDTLNSRLNIRDGSTRCKDSAARERFLERNRQAANRCRHRQRDAASALTRLEYEIEDYHRYLCECLHSLTTEMQSLKSELLRHTNCNCTLIQMYLAFEATTSVENMIGVSPSCRNPSAANNVVEILSLEDPGWVNGPIQWINPFQSQQPVPITPTPPSHCGHPRTVSDAIDRSESLASFTVQSLPQQTASVNSSPYSASGVHEQTHNIHGTCPSLRRPQ